MRKIFFSCFLFISFQNVFAQSSASFSRFENSPYSRYGIGWLRNDINVANRGMGNVSLADYNYGLIQANNPASYSGLKLTSFQFALEGVSLNVKNGTQANRTGSLNLSYFNVGFPIHKNAGMSFGLVPFSGMRYDLQSVQQLAGISEVTYNYFGGGSIQKAYLGFAYNYKDFSIGANFNYAFGNYQQNISESFTDSLQILSTSILSRSVVRGIQWQTGALFHHKIKEEKFINVGLTYDLGFNLNQTREKFWYSSLGDVGNSYYENRVDSSTQSNGKVVLPSKLGFGIMVGNGEQWKAGIDFTQSNWNKYSNMGDADSLQKIRNFGIGVAYTPNINAISDYWKRMTFRAGAYYRTEPFYLNHTSFSTKAITAGIGYPIRRYNLGIGQINAGLEMGSRGTFENGLVKEGLTRFSIGCTLNDKWFIKRKYE